MRTILTLIAVSTGALLSGCGGSDSNTSPIIQPPVVTDKISNEYQGIWHAPGHAMTMVVGSDSLDVYQHTSDYCLHIAKDVAVITQDLLSVVKTTEDEDVLEWYEGYGTATFSAPGALYQRVSDLTASCQSNLISMLDGADNSLNTLQIWDLYSQIFAENYVNFELKSVNWSQEIYDAGLELNTDSNQEELFYAMAKTLEPLADGHNYVQAEQGWYAKELTKPTLIQRLVEEYSVEHDLPFPISEELLSETLIDEINQFVAANLDYQWELVTGYASQPSAIKFAANGLIRWFENEDIGYLFVGGMTGYADANDLESADYAEHTLDTLNDALNQALTDLQHVNGLIVDVRTNDGGHDFVSLAIASRFTDNKVHAYSKQARDGQGRTPLRHVYIEPHDGIRYTGPISLLTSSSTVSAAEVFALSMSQLPNVIIIGEPSHGAFSDVMEWHLPNGFSIGLSHEFYLSPAGQWYEGQGVPVDINVSFYTKQQRDADVDSAIETAFAALSE